MEGTIKEVIVNRNTISVVAKFATYRGDVRLFADDVEVHPLIFNPGDRLHYSMIWLPEGTTINKLEGMDTTALATGSWTTLMTPKMKPMRTNVLIVSPDGCGTNYSHANPGDLFEAIKMAVDQGDTEIMLKDGVYKQADTDASGYMAIFQRAGTASFTGITIVAEHPRKAIVSNLLESGGFTTSLVNGTTSVYTIQDVPKPIYQVHAVVNGEIERLQEGATIHEAWTKDTLASSPIGGWYIDASTDQLVVKLADRSDPSGKLKISDTTHEKAWLFSNGIDLWVEGVVFEYWLRTLPTSHDGLGSSMLFHHCQQVVVRDCESRYTSDYAFHFFDCTDYLVEDCDFVDGQTFTSYLHLRHGPVWNQPNSPRFSGTIRNANSTLGTIRNNCWRQCFVVNQFQSTTDSSTDCIEFHHNHLFQARNHPILINNYNGGRHAIWSNKFDTCGQAMPNNEGASPISPIYWINNLAVDAGFFGTTFNNETSGAVLGNRFGGSTSSKLGQYFFYYNTLRVEWFPPNGDGADQIQFLNAWQSSNKEHTGSRYYNNIFTTIFRDIQNSNTGARQIMSFTGADVDGNLCLHILNVCRMRWDHNQYFWDRKDVNGNPTDVGAFNLKASPKYSFTFAEMQMWAHMFETAWEPHGAFQDPEFDVNSHPINAIPAMTIPGIIDNPVLGNPGKMSGSTI